MREYFPLLAVGAGVGAISTVLIIAYATMKDKKKAIGFERNMKDSEIVRRMAKYAKPYIGQLILAVALMAFSIAYDIVMPLIVGEVERRLESSFELSELYAIAIVYGSIVIVSLVCTYFQAILLQKTGQKIVSSLREDLFVKIESLSHAQLNSIPVGVLVTRETSDTGAISMLFTGTLINLLKNCFMLIGVLVAMLMLNYELTLMVLCISPFIVLFTLVFRKFTRREYRHVKDDSTDINVFLSENLTGIKITQIFNREKRKQEEFEVKSQRLCKSKTRQMLTFAMFRPLIYVLYKASVLLLLYLGGKGYIDNTSFLGQTITASTIVSFYMYLNKFFNPLQDLAEQFNIIQAAFASGEKVLSIMDIEPSVVDEPDTVSVDKIKGEIEFRDVWFAYKPEEWVLKGVSFKVKAGETVAFVGSTGSGKTTILSLICRNYDIQKGQILIDGLDIKHYKIADLRRNFGQMLQDVFLFSGTVRSNIVMRKEDVSDDEIMEVCRYVNADSFIEKTTHGLDEPVRERGNNFSAGQRQLLSFARTIIRRPSVMILDEATANIDTETEILIQDSLQKMRSIGTMLIVAHRLSTIRNADKIIVISHGEIIETGNHEELLEKHGKYYDLYTLQYKKEQLLKK